MIAVNLLSLNITNLTNPNIIIAHLQHIYTDIPQRIIHRDNQMLLKMRKKRNRYDRENKLESRLNK